MENVTCPDNEPIQNATLALMDNEGNVILAITSWTVGKGELFAEYLAVESQYATES